MQVAIASTQLKQQYTLLFTEHTEFCGVSAIYVSYRQNKKKEKGSTGNAISYYVPFSSITACAADGLIAATAGSLRGVTSDEPAWERSRESGDQGQNGQKAREVHIA